MSIQSNRQVKAKKSLFPKKGFTLAEVLVTLAIIGVVAALTIPALIQNTQKQQYVSQLKKTYSVLSQAILMYENENGCTGDLGGCAAFSGTGGASFDVQALNALAPYLNVAKNCGFSAGCVYATMKTLYGDILIGSGDWDAFYDGGLGKAILTDGTIIIVDDYNDLGMGTCTRNYGTGPLQNSVCGTIQIDINGQKAPNQLGRDVYSFWVTKTGIYPQGLYSDGKQCVSNAGQGPGYSEGCAAKVITDNSMNY